jgi:hypothetical protein
LQAVVAKKATVVGQQGHAAWPGGVAPNMGSEHDIMPPKRQHAHSSHTWLVVVVDDV